MTDPPKTALAKVASTYEYDKKVLDLGVLSYNVPCAHCYSTEHGGGVPPNGYCGKCSQDKSLPPAIDRAFPW